MKREATQEIAVVLIDPAQIKADDNARYSLKETRIESLAANIMTVGEIKAPMRVSPLPKPENGYKYRLNEGHYRHAAAMYLNEKQNAGVMCPCIIDEQNGLERLKLQIGENNERENMTPMDRAAAIKKLLDAGESRTEIRNMFSAPGGRKGLKNQPASNSFLNIHLDFLSLPKSIQDRIHDGRITLTGAMELVKVAPDKRAEVVEALEADRLAQIDKDEKAEQKLLDEEKKLTVAQEKENELKADLLKKQQEAEALAEKLKTKQQEAFEMYQKSKAPGTKPGDRRVAAEIFKALESDSRGLEKKLEGAAKEVEKVKTAAEKAASIAKARADELTKRRALKLKGKPAITKQDVQSQVAKSGVSSSAGPVPLTLPDVKAATKDISACGHPKVKEIGRIFQGLLSGATTTKQAIAALAVVTGEVKAKK